MKWRRRILALVLPCLLVPGAFAQWTAITASHIVDSGGNAIGTSAPTVAISGGGGSGATATVAVSNAQISSCTVTAGGSGYTSTPTATISGGSGSGATLALTLTSGAVTGCTVSAPGSGYTPYQPGQICVLPADTNNHPLGVRAGGSGGTVVAVPGCAWVVNGAITSSVGPGWLGNGTFVAPDTSLTYPQNACLRVTIKAYDGTPITPPGYNCVQMQSSWCTAGGSGFSSCNLDSYAPSPSPSLSLVSAPQFDPAHVTVSTLSPGSSATASIFPEGNGMYGVTLGIPAGEAGAAGPTGPPGSVSAASSFEGQAFADELQSPSGTGNNGIAQALAACASLPYSCQIAAPALYAATEVQPWGGARQWTGANTYSNLVNGPASGQPVGCVEDDRFGGPEWICNNGETPPSWAGQGTLSPVLGPSFTTYNTQANTLGLAYYTAPPALTANAYNLAGTDYNAFQSQFPALLVNQVNNALASAQGVLIQQYSNANGDTMPLEINHFQRGGLSTGDSEGAEVRIALTEAIDTFRGTINTITNQSGASTVCQGPCTIFKTAQTQGFSGSLGAGLPVYDLTQADTSGYVASISTAGVVTCTGCDWDSIYGDSAAHTTTTATLLSTGNTNPLTPPTSVCVPVASTTGFTTGGNAFLVDASGTFWEDEQITAINSGTCGSNTLTLAVVRQVFQSGSSIAEGGMAGMGIEFTADEVGPGATNGQYTPVNLHDTIRTVWPIAYNVAGGILYGPSSNEGHSFGKNYNTLAYSQMGSGGSVSCSLAGGSISSCTASGGTGYLNFSAVSANPSAYQAPPQLSISGLTCTTNPVIYISATSGGALSTVGIANAGAGCTGTPTITVTPTNGYAVYPMARALNVWNPSTGKVDGSSIATDMPAGTFSVGDTLEVGHYPIEQYRQVSQTAGYQGGSYSNPIVVLWGGRNGGDNAVTLQNKNAASLYAGLPTGATPYIPGKGQMETPNGVAVEGPANTAVYVQMPTFGSNAGIYPGALSVDCLVNQSEVCSSWNGWSILLNHRNGNTSNSGSDVLEYNPSTETWLRTANASGANGASPSWYEEFSSAGPTQGTALNALYPTRDTSGGATYAVGTGTAQAQVATPARTSPALSAGMVVRWTPAAANTGSGPTLAWSGLAAKTITKCGTSALVANDLLTTVVATAIYDGTYWELQNPMSLGCGGGGVGTGAVPELPWYSSTSGIVGDANLLDFQQSAVTLGGSYSLTGNITADTYCRIGITLVSPPTLPGSANGIFVTMTNLPSDFSYLNGIPLPYISQSGGTWTLFDQTLQNGSVGCSSISQAAASATAAVTASYATNGPVYSLAYLNYSGGVTASNATGQDYNWTALSPESSTSNGTESFNFYAADTNSLYHGANYNITLDASSNDAARYSANYQFTSTSESTDSGNYGANLIGGAHVNSQNFLWYTTGGVSGYGPHGNFYFGASVAPPFSGDQSLSSFEFSALSPGGGGSPSYPNGNFDVALQSPNSSGYNNSRNTNDVNILVGGGSDNGTYASSAHTDEINLSTTATAQSFAGQNGDYIGNINLSTSVTSSGNSPNSGNLVISLSNPGTAAGGALKITTTGPISWSSSNSSLTSSGALTVASCTGCGPGGTVTNVGLSSPGVLYSVTGSPVTSSGTLTLNLINQSANTVMAGPSSGSSAAPSFRALVSADIPNNAANTSGTAANLSGTPTLPNGTAGTTQATTDATTLLATDAYVQNNLAAQAAVPAWLRNLGNGADGSENCSGNYAGDFWLTSFTVSLGNTCTVNSNAGLIVHATGACVINGTITAQDGTGAQVGGGAAGGSGGGTAAASTSNSTYYNPAITGRTVSAAGSTGGSTGGSGGNAGSIQTLSQRALFYSGGGADGVFFGGGASGAGGSSGGAGVNGGGGVVLICGSITGTGTINASGLNGNNSGANNEGASAGGGGGVVILSSQATETFGITINVAAGTAGSCLSYTGCGTPGTSTAGWYMEVSGW